MKRGAHAKRRTVVATKKRIAVVAVIAGAVVAAGGGIAAAAFAAQTTSTTNISTGIYRWGVTGGGTPSSGPASLLPKSAPQVFTFTVADTGTLAEDFSSTDLTATVTSNVVGCPSSDFVTSIDTHGATGTKVAPGGHVTATVTVALNTAATTNGCQGTSPTVTLTITAKD